MAAGLDDVVIWVGYGGSRRFGFIALFSAVRS